MTDTENQSKVIVIGGKRLTIADVQKSFAELDLLGNPGTMKVAGVLLNAKEPLTRDQLAAQTTLSSVYIIDVITNLEEYDYIASFHIGTNKRRLYYALTEKGYNALCSRDSGPK
jgi:DNA-binding MarR family transcriptional regulator